MLDILVIKTIKICSLQVYILKTVTFYRAARMIFESANRKVEEAIIGKNGGGNSQTLSLKCVTKKKNLIKIIPLQEGECLMKREFWED